VEAEGSLHAKWGIDYFVFPKHSPLLQIPRFAVGRPAWDNWMIFHARSLGIPTIDASQVVHPVHQNHDYGHIPDATGVRYNGPEAERNRDLLRSLGDVYELDHTDWVLTDVSLRRRQEDETVPG
jgi:hypothetical protein